MSQDIRHYFFHNDAEVVDGDGRSGYWSQTIPSNYRNSGGIVRSLVLIVMVMTEVVIGFIPSHFLCITMVEYKFPTGGFLKKIFQRLWKEKIHIKKHP